ncbi:amidohydrolase [Thermoanaerobacterium thermosaccharolyticum DSM 571]|uniref:Amidohydrolase n=1 Tax=Thermoanaerobacterium thermosaccharolyticum (strain ATCC 7956 / DSM 571 / NCIMB 9385 / NCA 3814 / NCTC 13789 / WDCM 00135 / 2032) TaxID=580327 RepID=D9TQF5_THETC|nr:amidohydrolase/deacetylase family metallohydrolase [Thermoanaerobacterium thermosaccharolyticum]ADL69189.1 amidohydrolase [Thermoanaerobacterium thermosaccharolyticum DSM 571]
MDIDLLIKNGHVLDPSNNINGKYDVAISNGKIQSILKPGNLNQSNIKNELDVSGNLVIPGLIDLHVHVFPNRTLLGTLADNVGIKQGVTTVVDAGSTGVKYLNYFMKEVVENNNTRILLWINIASQGLCEGLSELADLKYLEPDKVIEAISNNNLIRGIKVRMSSSVVKGNGIRPLEIAKNLSQKIGVPLMVHIGNYPPYLADILNLLDAGDVVTHAFHGKKGGILNENGYLIPEAEKALKRGVLFDVGHGTSSFSFKTIKRTKELGLNPSTISTDIYNSNLNGPVYNMAITMTKLIAMGYSLEDVVKATTNMPAKVLRMENEIGNLRVGTVADISILTWKHSPIKLKDSMGEEVLVGKYLVPLYTIKSGEVFKCNE